MVITEHSKKNPMFNPRTKEERAKEMQIHTLNTSNDLRLKTPGLCARVCFGIFAQIEALPCGEQVHTAVAYLRVFVGDTQAC